jgi:hypothetical protein
MITTGSTACNGMRMKCTRHETVRHAYAPRG